MSKDRDAIRRAARRAQNNAGAGDERGSTVDNAAKYARRAGAAGSSETLKRKAAEELDKRR